MSRFPLITANVSPYHSQNGDRRATGHIRQHAWRVIIPSGCAVSLRRRQQPQETGLKYGNIFWKCESRLFDQNAWCFLVSGTYSASNWKVCFSFFSKLSTFLTQFIIFSFRRTDGILTNMETTSPPPSPSPVVKR